MSRGRRLVRLLAVMLAALCLQGCHRAAAPRADWAFDARLVFLHPDLRTEREPMPPAQYRLVFPYICGDIYGSVTTGDLLAPTTLPGGLLHIDLNHAQAALAASLEPTEFSLSFLKMQPTQARVARLSPLMLEADGIEQVGQVAWVDADTRQTLMLLYFDRAAAITGISRENADGKRATYAIQAPGAGYVWVGRHEEPGGMVYGVVPRPAHLLLGVTAPERHSPASP